MGGRGSGEGFMKTIGQYLEKNLLIDIGTICTLGLNFYLLQEHMGFGDSLLSISSDVNTVAAQLTGLMMIIYLAETLADKHNSGGSRY